MASSSSSKAASASDMIRSLLHEDPWSVDIVGAIPQVFIEQNRTVVNSAVSGRWHVVCTRQQEDTEATFQLTVWYSSPDATLAKQKNNTDVVSLKHDILGYGEHVPLLAVASPKDEDCYIYAIHPTKQEEKEYPQLLLWKLQRHAMGKMSKSTAVMKDLVITNIMALQDANDPQIITSLSVHWKNASTTPSMVLVGTKTGQVHYVVQDPRPLFLRAYHVTGATGSLFQSLLSKVSYQEKASTDLVAVVPCWTRRETFCQLAKTGKMIVWNVVPSSNQKSNTFHIAAQTNILDLLRDSAESSHNSVPLACEIKTAVAVDDTLHVLCLTQHHNGSTQQDESRLYWVTLNLATSTSAAAAVITLRTAVYLDRFLAPSSVTIHGLCGSTNGIAYACFETAVTAHSIVMACTSHDGVVAELDLLPGNVALRIMPNSLAPDWRTHGVTALERLGLGLRVRLAPPENDSDYDGNDVSSSSSSRVVPKLVKHLTSEFWNSYHQPHRAIQAPPSLERAQAADLEAACLTVAEQLRDKGEAGANNPSEWHLTLVGLLQNTGLYRRLSPYGMWKLLSIGQEVSVFQMLGAIRAPPGSWEETQLQNLDAKGVGEWLTSVQASAMASAGVDNNEIWCQWLHQALVTAITYRDERAAGTYDVVPGRVPRVTEPKDIPVFTSSPYMRRVVSKQLQFWNSQGTGGVNVEMVESIVEYAVQSCSDSFASCATNDTKEAYLSAQKDSFRIIRELRGLKGDVFLWDLAKKHRSFGLLCQMALDHETRSDRCKFSLNVLFKEELGNQQDIEFGLKFGKFVLTWYTERELYGHVLDYGKDCPEDLAQMIQTVNGLKEYRFIVEIRRRNYGAVVDSLLNNSKRSGISVNDASFAIRTASVANSILEGDATPNEKTAARRQAIDQQSELVNASFALFGRSENARSKPFQGSSQLLDEALKQFDAADSRKIQEEKCFTALAVCTGINDDILASAGAQTVWVKVILADTDRWKNWVHTETDYTSPTLHETVLQETIFGVLLQASESTPGWQKFSFRSVVSDEDMHQLQGAYALFRQEGMRRLLQSVTSNQSADRGVAETGADLMIVDA